MTARRLYGVLTCIAFLVFARVAVRHVGEAAFLEDQVDQLQNFESLLRLNPEGLWGAVMSGTSPPARALGPLGALVFGAPVALGLGIDSVHVLTSLLMVIAVAAVFITLARIDAAFAWLWFLIFSTTGVLWWNAGMFWTNTLLLPLGLTMMALAVSCLNRPRVSTLTWMLLTQCFALQLHLVSIVAAPIIGIVGAVSFREARRQWPGRVHAGVMVVAAVAAIGPYVAAESITGFQNTRAVFTQLESASRGGRGYGLDTAATTLSIAADPWRLFDSTGLDAVLPIAIGTAIALSALATGWRRRKRDMRYEDADRVVFWLTVCSVTAIVGQALFFFWMARPFAGFHHVTMLAPFYAVAPAALIRWRVPGQLASPRGACVLGGISVALLAWAGPSLADRFVERTPWSYRRIVAALDALCGDAAVDTREGAGFAAQLNPRNDSVLRYLMKRRFATCGYEAGSEIVIAAGRDEHHGPRLEIDGAEYRLELELPPGIARYRRWK